MNVRHQPSLRCLVLGGTRSGKSAYAQARVAAHGEPLAYLATAQPGDVEMAQRIARHQANRGPGWYTVEAPVELHTHLQQQNGQCKALLLDCITLWLTNLVGGGLDDQAVVERLREVLAVIHELTYHLVIVSSELGLGIVPENPLARRFRDLIGEVNQMIAEAMDEAVFVVAGQPLTLKASSVLEAFPSPE